MQLWEDNMPQIQVLGREALEDTMNQRNDATQRMQMIQDGMFKAQQIKMMGEEYKLRAKLSQDELEKVKFQQKGEKFKALSSGITDVMKMPGDPQKNLLAYYQMFQDQMHDVIGDKDFQAMISKLEPSAEERGKMANAKLLEDYNAKQAAKIQDNSNRINAISGNMPAPMGAIEDDTEWIPDTTGTSGVTGKFVSRNRDYIDAMNKSAGTEAGRPYTESEADRLVKGESVQNSISQIIKLVDKGVLDGLGAQTIVDIGNPLLASQMSQDTRDALNYLNQIKTVIPFMFGGKQLTPFESKLVFRLLNTQGKTPAMIKRDLKVYREQADTYKKLLSTPKGLINANKRSLLFGGGKDYEDLVGGKVTKSGILEKDPLGLFE